MSWDSEKLAVTRGARDLGGGEIERFGVSRAERFDLTAARDVIAHATRVPFRSVAGALWMPAWRVEPGAPKLGLLFSRSTRSWALPERLKGP